jgi:hypothetical protein
MNGLIQVSAPKSSFVCLYKQLLISKFYYYRNTQHRSLKPPNPSPQRELLSTCAVCHYFPHKIFFSTCLSMYIMFSFYKNYILIKIFAQNLEAQDLFCPFLIHFFKLRTKTSIYGHPNQDIPHFF